MEEVLEIKRIGDIDVYFRKPFKPLTSKSQPEELELIVKHLTNEDFRDYAGKYKRKLINPEKFEMLDKYIDVNEDLYICVCSEYKCNHLVIIKYIPTEIYFTVGSICYLRFNEENSTELYYKTKAKKCNDCSTPLVFKECKYHKNTDKKCNGTCYGCIYKKEEIKQEEENTKRIYLFVKYEDKDDAKLLGAKWDVENRRWYAPNNSFVSLLEKYKTYALKK